MLQIFRAEPCIDYTAIQRATTVNTETQLACCMKQHGGRDMSAVIIGLLVLIDIVALVSIKGLIKNL